MNKNKADFEKHLQKAGVSGEVVAEIVSVPYQTANDEKQDNANFCAAVMAKCEELLDLDTIKEMMCHRACCKSGFRLSNARRIAQEHGEKSLADKLVLLGEEKYMGHPSLTESGDIYTGTCAGSGAPDDLRCSCWRFGGRFSSGGSMPLSYCLCCGGHFVFHYQKALGLKLRVKEVVTSVFGDPPQYCSFLLEIVNSDT